MKHQQPAVNRTQALDSDAEAADEEFPQTRFFTDAIARNTAPLKRRRRGLTVMAIVTGFALALVALLGLAAWLTL